MRHRTTTVLLALFFAGLGALLYFERAAVPTREQWEGMLGRVLPGLIDTPVGEVEKVEVDRGSGKGPIVVERRAGGGWQLRRPVDAAADPDLVETLVRNLKDLRKSPDAGTIQGDPVAYGLDRPEATVRVFVRGKPGEPAAALQVGKTVENRAYVRPAGGSGIEVVDARLIQAVGLDPEAWRDTALFRVPSFRVESVTIGEPPRPEIQARRDERRWRLVSPVKAPADDDKVEGLVAELSALRVADGPKGFVEDGVRDRAKYGLAEPSMTLALTPFAKGGEPQVLYLGKPVPDKANQVYAMRGDQDDVVRVDVKTLREAIPGVNGLRSQKVLDFAPARASRVRIEARGKRFDLARTSRGWELLSPVREPADPAAAQSLLMRLAELKASEFLDPSRVVEPRLNEPSFRVRVWQPEPGGAPAATSEGLGEPRVDLSLGRHDVLKRTIFGRIAGDETVLAIPDEILRELPRNDFAYRDRTILTLKPEQFARVTVERGGLAVTVAAPGAKGSPVGWKVTEPVVAKADDTAVTALVMTLANLRAESWESDRVGDGKAFGLDSPWLRVKWSLQKGATTGSADPNEAPDGVLRVGKVKPGGGPYYANIEGTPRVFALNPGVVAPFEAELHDRTVVAFKPAEAERVVLRWPSRTLALARPGRAAGAPWAVEPGYDPSGFDPGRVGSIVAALADLKTPRFLQYAGPLPSSSGLAPPQLSVTVKTAGGGPEKTLRVGRVLPEGQFVATNAAGGEGPVFVLPANAAWNDLLTPPGRLGDLPADVFAPAPGPAKPPGG